MAIRDWFVTTWSLSDGWLWEQGLLYCSTIDLILCYLFRLSVADNDYSGAKNGNIKNCRMVLFSDQSLFNLGEEELDDVGEKDVNLILMFNIMYSGQ